MSASKNPDAMNSAQGEFSSRVAPAEPQTTKGHKPGVKVGNDAVPEFNAKSSPPGTAPASRTFQPQPDEIPSQAQNPNATVTTAASETLPGSTSADVDQGYGKPASGMTSQELHGGKHKKERSGLEGVGASLEDPIHKNQHDREHETGYRGIYENPADKPAAENYPGQTAENVAAERR